MKLAVEPIDFLKRIETAGIDKSHHEALVKKIHGIRTWDYKIEAWELELLTGNPAYYEMHHEKITREKFSKSFYAVWSGNIAVMDNILQKEGKNEFIKPSLKSSTPIILAAALSRDIAVLIWFQHKFEALFNDQHFPRYVAEAGWLEGLIWLVQHNPDILNKRLLFRGLQDSIVIPFFDHLKKTQQPPTSFMQDFIYYLVMEDKRAVMEEFLQAFPEMADRKIKHDMNILHVAACMSSAEMMYLVANFKQELMKELSDSGWNFLDYAVFSGDGIKINCALELCHHAANTYEMSPNCWQTDRDNNLELTAIKIKHAYHQSTHCQSFPLDHLDVLIKNNQKIQNIRFPKNFKEDNWPECQNIRQSLKRNQNLAEIWTFTALLLIVRAKDDSESVLFCFPKEIIWQILLAPLKNESIAKKPLPLSFFEQKRQNKDYSAIAPAEACTIL